jgi:hypothetical protein
MIKLRTVLVTLSVFFGLTIPLGSQPAAAPGSIFDVRQFGATGKRADNATRAIRAAVEACFAAGGGVVYIPPGGYTTGTIELRNNVNLHLEAGATLFLSQNKEDFGGQRTMIYAAGAKNIAVTGRGTLDGLAQYEWVEPRGADPEIAEETEIARRGGVEMRRYYRIGMQTYMFIVNSDGIDVVSSSNVVISDCIIVTADDAIVLKTVARGRAAKPVENVTVTNCILTSSSTPMMIGTETEADIRHVIFSNSVIRNSNKGFGINVQDGATVSDVVFSNITMDLSRRHWNWWGSAETFRFVLKKRRPDSRLGAIRDIVVDNVISHARGTSTIIGHPDRPIQNITISNLQMFVEAENAVDKRASDAMRIEGVVGCKLRNVSVKWAEDKVEPKWASAAVFRNVRGLELDNFSGRQGIKSSATPALLFENVTAALLRDSRADAGCGTFLSVRGSASKNIRLQNNDLEEARRPIEFENGAGKKAVVTGSIDRR